MSARVHAIIVARPGPSSRAQLLRTLDALSLQTTRPDAITLVVCGDGKSARESEAVARSVEGIIEARSSTSFAEAVELAYPRVLPGTAVWVLAHDTAPAPAALAQLAGALERSPSAAFAAPKLVNSDSDRELVSLGISMTALGRSVELAAGELDQGQHDGVDDALGSDIRGILIRGAVREALKIDRALAGADEGLDLGVRARLGGGRVVLAPAARVLVSPDGPAALPQGASRRAFVTRLAQLHRRLAYAPALVVPLHWLLMLPLALWRSITHLVGKRPAEVLPEWGAALTAMARFGAVARSRARIKSFRTSTFSAITPLRVTQSQLRRRLDDGHGSERGAVSELHFFGGGGAWAVLAALVVSVASFTSLLAWPVLGGGGLLPLRETVSALWADAAWGVRSIGSGVIGPADPFAGVLAVLGSLWAGAPSFALVLLWILALPLAVLGGWFAATRLTDRSGLRLFGGLAWALSPTFLTALVEGRPAAVLVHLLLPWLFHTALVAHRSWGAAGAASIVLAAVLACSPSLAPAVVVLWLVAVAFSLARASVHGAVRLLWVLIPAAALFAPLVIWQLQHGTGWALLADPGASWLGDTVPATAEGRLALAGGFPTPDLAGWMDVLAPPIAVWAPLLCAPIALLAVLSAIAPRWRAGVTTLIVVLAGLATAFVSVGIMVTFVNGTPVAVWPGTGLSLAWLGVVGGAVITLETAITLPRLRGISATIALGTLIVCAVPALTAAHTGRSNLTDGPATTLPAFIAAEARGDEQLGTLVLTPTSEGSLGVDVVWGESDTLGARSTILSTASEPVGDDLSELAVDLITARSFDAAGTLAENSISFVLLDSGTEGESDAARSLRVGAVTALDQRAGFVKAGETDKGTLWRLESPAEAREGMTLAERSFAHLVAAVQIGVLLAAVLLAIPTRASRRAARATSRVVGRAPDEPMRLRSHHDDDDFDEAKDSAPVDATPVVQQGDAQSEPIADSDAQATAPEDDAPVEEPHEDPAVPEAHDDEGIEQQAAENDEEQR